MRKYVGTGATIARNLRFLIRHREWTEKELADLSGVSQKKINHMLNNTQDTTAPICDLVAKPFGLEGWVLMVKDLPESVLSSGTIGKLVNSYNGTSDEGREHILRVAEREVKYAVK